MPEICRFFGMVIAIFYDEHNPPHFHVRYGKYKASFRIDTLEKMDGKLPKRAEKLIIEWAYLHRKDLMENWNKALKHLPLRKIKPLE